MTGLLIECPGCGFVKAVEQTELPADAGQVSCIRCGRSFPLQPVFTSTDDGTLLRTNSPEQWDAWQELTQQRGPVDESAPPRRRLRFRFPGRWFSVGCTLSGLTVGLTATAIWFDLFLQQPILPQALRAKLLVSMQDAGLLRSGGVIMLGKQSFRPGESMLVKVAYTDDVDPRAQLCCAPVEGTCFSRHAIETDPAGFTSLQIVAPAEPGRYELRLSPRGGEAAPVTHMEFTVR
ncbi:MAG: hypothetical protein RQ723_05415 [Desulfuromonadales bacterium]|nr:hypothetical protein [Desulfuromonadales bacterium]